MTSSQTPNDTRGQKHPVGINNKVGLTGYTRLEWCEMCGYQRRCFPVCIDDNMETYMCGVCIAQARTEIKIEVMPPPH